MWRLRCENQIKSSITSTTLPKTLRKQIEIQHLDKAVELCFFENSIFNFPFKKLRISSSDLSVTQMIGIK